MSSTTRIARPLLAGIFITGGLAALKQPGPKAEAVKQSGFADKLPQQVPSSVAQPANLVRLNGAADVLGGFALATGRMPRLASLGLIASMVPMTYVGHPFWAQKDKAARAQQQVQFFKNLGVIGGLLLSASDTGGRESVPHAAGRLTRQAKKDAKSAAKDARAAARSAKDSAAKSAAKSSHKAARSAAKTKQRALDALPV